MKWLHWAVPRRTAGHTTDAVLFQHARLRLTAWYVATLALIVVAFSVALYLAFAAQLPAHRGDGDRLEPRQEVERETSDFALSRLRLLLVGGNVVLLCVGAAGAYALAGKTLQPVAQAMARQRRFAADASHELRTPLTVIRGTIDVTLARDRSQAEYRTVLEEVNEEAASLTTLVEQLLQLARATKGEPRSAGATDVRQTLEEVVRRTQLLAERQQSRVELACEPGLTTAVDAAVLRQILLNLVENALRHTPPGTTVRVLGTRQGHHTLITVRDNGPGIPADARQHIFEPFFRLDSSAAEGAGLGLTLVQELVAASGGTVTLDDAAAAGASFSVRLPVRQ